MGTLVRERNEMRQKNAYSKLTGHYDDVSITGRKWWSRLYMHGLWRVDDNRVASEVLEMIPNGICGTVLDVTLAQLYLPPPSIFGWAMPKSQAWIIPTR